MTISKTLEISVGHRLHLYVGPCSNFHGHNYKVNIHIDYSQEENFIRKEGFYIDFAKLKKIIVEAYDHKFLMSMDDQYVTDIKKLNLPGFKFVPYSPTAENIAIDMAGLLYNLIKKKNGNLESVKIEIFETSNSSVIFAIHNNR
ncbi:6-carboxytetrahydropterin synthase [Patescibacteria group bacterium]|nr:6-carboxytetrahydropterin synthase [Patescibacteria group bacterium]MCL5798354.1 6-carboxytetrahydropterin synthase [Patescibacteria group bacterium]